MCRGGFLQTLRLREERSHNQSLAVENGLILLTRSYNLLLSISDLKPVVRGGGGYCHIWATLVCAAVKGMVFKQFTLG